jgi:hypothetical protein
MATKRNTGDDPQGTTEAGGEDGGLMGRRTKEKRGEAVRLGDAFQDARRSFDSMWSDLREQLEERPWRTLGMAAAAGYVVGGGLFSALTGRLLLGGLKVGVRVAALPLVRNELMGFIETLSTDRGRGENERRHQ